MRRQSSDSSVCVRIFASLIFSSLRTGTPTTLRGCDDFSPILRFDRGSALTIYTTEEGMSRVLAMYPYAMAERPIAKGYAAFKLTDMPALLELPQGTIRSTLLPHGGITTLGLIFTERSSGKKFVYYTDCKCVPREALGFARGAHAVCLDGLRPLPHPSHMSITEACAAAAEIGAPQTWLTHLTQSNRPHHRRGRPPAGCEICLRRPASRALNRIEPVGRFVPNPPLGNFVRSTRGGLTYPPILAACRLHCRTHLASDLRILYHSHSSRAISSRISPAVLRFGF